MKICSIGLLLILFLVNCNPTSTAPDNPLMLDEFDPNAIFSGPVTNVELGFSQQQIIDVMGQPTSIAEFSGNRILLRYGDSLDFNLIVDLSTNESELFSFAADSGYQSRSATGLGLGSTRDEVVAELGDPFRVARNQVAQGDFYFFRETELAVLYELGTDTTVAIIRVSFVDNDPDN